MCPLACCSARALRSSRILPLVKCAQRRFVTPACLPSPFAKQSVRVPQQVNSLPTSVLLVPSCRWSGKKSGRNQKMQSDDQEDESETWAEVTEEEDRTLNKDSKVVILTLQSMRADLLIKAGLNMARNKVEALFYEGKIRVNGKALKKKSDMIYVGDEIDIVRGPSQDNPKMFIEVTRLIVLSAAEKDGVKISVKLRRFAKLTIDSSELE